MNPFEKAWALLKGEYMHPSVMGHFARARMAREDSTNRKEDGTLRPREEKLGVSQYTFNDDEHAEPPPYDPTIQEGPLAPPPKFYRDFHFDRLTQDAKKRGYQNPLHRLEEGYYEDKGFRPKVRERAASYSQQEVDDFIERLHNPQSTLFASNDQDNLQYLARARQIPLETIVDENGISQIPTYSTSSLTDAENQAYGLPRNRVGNSRLARFMPYPEYEI